MLAYGARPCLPLHAQDTRRCFCCAAATCVYPQESRYMSACDESHLSIALCSTKPQTLCARYCNSSTRFVRCRDPARFSPSVPLVLPQITCPHHSLSHLLPSLSLSPSLSVSLCLPCCPLPASLPLSCCPLPASLPLSCCPLPASLPLSCPIRLSLCHIGPLFGEGRFDRAC
jgi:hypothetical protein